MNEELDENIHAEKSAPSPPILAVNAPAPLLFEPLLWLILVFVLGIALPFLPVPTLTLAIIGGIVLTALYVTSIVFFAVSATRTQPKIGVVVALFLASLALWALMQFWALGKIGALFYEIEIQNVQPTTAQWLLRVAASTLGDVALIAAATLGGSLVARLIRAPNMLGPLCAMIALIDIWGVLFGGIVSQLMAKAPSASAAAMASMPQAGAIAAATGIRSFPIPLPNIGAGDYLFLGLLFYALQNLNMNWRGAMKWTIPFVTVTLLLVAFGEVLADWMVKNNKTSLVTLLLAPILARTGMMPGLLPIGLGVALPNLRFFRFTREENFAMLYAGIFVVILSIGLFFFITSQLPPDAPAPR